MPQTNIAKRDFKISEPSEGNRAQSAQVIVNLRHPKTPRFNPLRFPWNFAVRFVLGIPKGPSLTRVASGHAS
jgi:hypothetical protein